MDLLVAIEAAATAEVGAKVTALIVDDELGKSLTLTSDDGFTHIFWRREVALNPWQTVMEFKHLYWKWWESKLPLLGGIEK